MVGLQSAGELAGLAESEEVPAGHFLGGDAQSVLSDVALAMGGGWRVRKRSSGRCVRSLA